MPAFNTPIHCSGEITERAELLNGAIQLALDGETADSEDSWTAELALSWRLGRVGAVALDEGDLTLEGDGREVVAVLAGGSAEVDADTGDVEIEATFEVEAASGVDLEPGAPLRARLAISAERWSGELRAGGGAD